jgi:hypothetical protein
MLHNLNTSLIRHGRISTSISSALTQQIKRKGGLITLILSGSWGSPRLQVVWSKDSDDKGQQHVRYAHSTCTTGRFQTSPPHLPNKLGERAI